MTTTDRTNLDAGRFGFRLDYDCLAILVLALSVHLLYFFSFPPMVYFDSSQYLDMARSIAYDGAFWSASNPILYRTPGYPLFLAVFIKLFGFSSLPVLIAQSVLAAFTVAVYSHLAKQLFGRWTALSLGVFLSFSPYLLFVDHSLMSETLFNFTLSLCLLYFFNVQAAVVSLRGESPQIGNGDSTLNHALTNVRVVSGQSHSLLSGRGLNRLHFLFLGALAGFMILVKPAGILIALMMLLYIIFIRSNMSGPTLARTVLYSCGVILIVFPWVLGNIRNHGYRGISSVGPVNFWHGLVLRDVFDPSIASFKENRDEFERAMKTNNPDADFEYMAGVARKHPLAAFTRKTVEWSIDSIREHPLKYLEKTFYCMALAAGLTEEYPGTSQISHFLRSRGSPGFYGRLYGDMEKHSPEMGEFIRPFAGWRMATFFPALPASTWLFFLLPDIFCLAGVVYFLSRKNIPLAFVGLCGVLFITSFVAFLYPGERHLACALPMTAMEAFGFIASLLARKASAPLS